MVTGLHVFTAAKAGMFLSSFVCLSVFLPVCLSVPNITTLWTNFDDFLSTGMCDWRQLTRFWCWYGSQCGLQEFVPLQDTALSGASEAIWKWGPEHQRQKGRGDVGAEGAEFEEGVPFPTEKSGDDDAPLPRIFFLIFSSQNGAARWHTFKFKMTGAVTEKAQIRLTALKLLQITKTHRTHAVDYLCCCVACVARGRLKCPRIGCTSGGSNNTEPSREKVGVQAPSPRLRHLWGIL